MMAVEAARRLRDGMVCFVGIGLPSLAANLARRTHAPGCVLIYESGTIGAKPLRLPLSIGDGELAETADTVVSVPEMFSYWLQGGRIDVGFLGAAQIDRHGNLNSTVIGDYDRPRVRLPGGGGDLEGPVFGEDALDPNDDDLTKQGAGEPLGERIIVQGRVLDEDGRPLRGALVEIWQANAAGRYRHDADRHPAPLDPNF